ncbi:MAG TPA: efflux RND transporter periplasmic adaptor subunit [Tepidisphaeraceae bacterium]|jgi:multidrug efflux pump subunit AcrA (membrane-fusion protein)|nr:efflux RND transporter periplasmic adaptor subunit [Tepidisphaeraceae bacterium]
MHRRRAQSTVRFISLICLAAAIAAALALFVFHLTQPLVTVTEAVRGPVVQAFYSTGTIQPDREFPIKSNTAGILTEVKIDKGDHVTKDQPLAVVSDPALVYARDKAQAELDEAMKRADESTSPVLSEFDSKISADNSMLDIAKREEQRLKDAQQTNAASPSALDQASSRVKQIWSEVEGMKSQRAAKKLELDRMVDVSRAALRTAEWNVDQQTLKSPIAGVVLDRPTSIGTRVAVNDVLTNVADVKPANLVMRAAVDEEDIAKVSVGQSVRMTLYAFPNQVFIGQATRIYDRADPERRTFEVDVKFDEPNNRFSPGMTGELAWIMAEKDSAIVVPAQALQNNTIYVVDGSKISKRTVEVGLKSVERAEILTGIQPGDRVVITPPTNLDDGQHVRIQYTDPVSAAGLNKKVTKEDGFKGFNR